MEPEQARFRLFDGVTSFLRRASKDRPMLLFLDDLQWADEASLKLLEFLASETSHASLVLIFADLGFREKAEKEFEKLVINGFADIPQDGLWSTSMCYLTEVCRFLGDQRAAAIL
jgi:hypothetical protein